MVEELGGYARKSGSVMSINEFSVRDTGVIRCAQEAGDAVAVVSQLKLGWTNRKRAQPVGMVDPDVLGRAA